MYRRDPVRTGTFRRPSTSGGPKATRIGGPRGAVGYVAAHDDASVDYQDKPIGLNQNLFAVLMRSKEFKAMFEEVRALGLQIVPGKGLSSRGTRKPGGSYDPYSNTLELPTDVLHRKVIIRDVDILETIAHEARHAYQHRSILRKSQELGGGEEVRTKLIDEAMSEMGREEFIRQQFLLEEEAQSFAIRIVLQVLRESHPKFQSFRREIQRGASPKQYHKFMLSTWWNANRDKYEAGAKYKWNKHLERIAAPTTN
jgi:hypothetical protein